MPVSIRPAVSADLPRVREVLRRTWHHTYDSILGRAKVAEVSASWHSLENLSREQASKDRTLLIAEDGGQALGTASGHRTADGAFVVARLYVLPTAQGGGVGKALLAELLRHAGDSSQVRLEVEPKNQQAIAWYQRQGFRVIGQSDDCGGHGSDIGSLVMERER